MTNNISPVTRSKKQARDNYNRLSGWYDWIAGSEDRYRQKGVLALNLQPAERLLEIGFGTGSCLLDFGRQVGPDGWVCGIDISDGMAAVADQRTSKAGLGERVSLLLGDAVELPFAGHSFDAVFASFTLELFDTPDIARVLQQCARILRPEGRLAVVTLIKSEQPGFAERIYEWFHARMPVTVDCRPIWAQPAIREAGFDIVEVISEKMWGLPLEIIVGKK